MTSMKKRMRKMTKTGKDGNQCKMKAIHYRTEKSKTSTNCLVEIN